MRTMILRPSFVVAVSGHRDIHPDDAPRVARQLREVLRLAAAALPHTVIDCLSPLADGADQLFAAEVLRLARALPGRLRLTVPLPMAMEDYVAAQGGAEFAARMAPGLAGASDVFVVPGVVAGEAPEAAYLRLTDYLSRRAQLIAAVWDGQLGPVKPGGTLDMVLKRLERHEGPLVHVPARRLMGSPPASQAFAALAIAGRDAGGALLLCRQQARASAPGNRRRRALARAEAVCGHLDPTRLAVFDAIWRSGRDIER